MSDSRRLGFPVLVMVVSTLIVYLISKYISGAFVASLLTIILAITLFMFGITLNKNHRKNASVYRKVIALVFTIILVFIQLDAISMPLIDQIRVFLQMSPILTTMLYIYFGYVFVD